MVIHMHTPKDSLVCYDNVMEAYLSTSTVLPILAIGQQAPKFLYRLFPEFSAELLKTEMPPPLDLVAKCRKKLNSLALTLEMPTIKPIQPESAGEDGAIEVWVYVWCRAFPSHDIREHIYRLEQLLKVLQRYKVPEFSKQLQLYSDVMETCYKFGSAFLAVVFFESIESLLIRAQSSVFSWYLLAISSHQNKFSLQKSPRKLFEKSVESKKRIAGEAFANYQAYFRTCTQPYQQRSFLTEAMKGIICEEIKIGFGLEQCPECESSQKLGVLLSLIQHEVSIYSQRLKITCASCNAELGLSFRVRIGRPVVFSNDKSVYWQKQFALMRLDELKEKLKSMGVEREGRKVIELSTLREKEAVFWNLVCCFSVVKLPYDLFVPYKKLERNSMLREKERRGELEKVGSKEHEVWFDKFKQIRNLALCSDSGTQTDSCQYSPAHLCK